MSETHSQFTDFSAQKDFKTLQIASLHQQVAIAADTARTTPSRGIQRKLHGLNRAEWAESPEVNICK